MFFDVVIIGFEANGAASDGNSGEILSEPFYHERLNDVVFLKGGAIMEHMTVCSGIVVAGVVSGGIIVEDGKGGEDHAVIEAGGPGMIDSVGRSYHISL